MSRGMGDQIFTHYLMLLGSRDNWSINSRHTPYQKADFVVVVE